MEEAGAGGCLQQGRDLENCHQPNTVMEVPAKVIQEPAGLLKNRTDLDVRRSGHCSIFCKTTGKPHRLAPLLPPLRRWVCLTSSPAGARGSSGFRRALSHAGAFQPQLWGQVMARVPTVPPSPPSSPLRSHCSPTKRTSKEEKSSYSLAPCTCILQFNKMS